MSVFYKLQNAIIPYLNDNLTLPIAWPNRKYDGSKPYHRVSFLPAPVASIGLRSIDRYDGFIQIDTVVESDTGAIVVAGYCADILTLFPRNSIIKGDGITIRFNLAGYTSPAVQDVDGYFIPVSIPYTIID